MPNLVIIALLCCIADLCLDWLEGFRIECLIIEGLCGVDTFGFVNIIIVTDYMGLYTEFELGGWGIVC